METAWCNERGLPPERIMVDTSQPLSSVPPVPHGSEVRATGAAERRASTSSAPPAGSFSGKMEAADRAFRSLASDDPRARLLRIAVLRRDEVLLDALLRRIALPPTF